ncbi:hypothetical protein ACWDUC_14390 [Streptomyces tricolor]
MSEPIKTVEEAVAALGPLAETNEAGHGPLWSLLDWSFWGAGMGDVFREALADRMIAAIPARGVEHAEALMAEFIRRRQIEKTGVTVYQEQRAELDQLRARVAELEKSSPVGADATPDFFQPGHSYTQAEFPQYDWRFRCDTVTTHPEDGERTALGWRFWRGNWEAYAYGEDDWEIHQHVGLTDVTGTEAAR